MTFSLELEQRLSKLMNSYPQGRIRSALIPMLLYCQDEVGHISEELMLECAKRLGLSRLQVDEVIGYYSMLHKKPWGKYHVQVCTNVSCLEVLRALRSVSPRRGRVHRSLLLGAGDSGQLRLSSQRHVGDARQNTR